MTVLGGERDSDNDDQMSDLSSSFEWEDSLLEPPLAACGNSKAVLGETKFPFMEDVGKLAEMLERCGGGMSLWDRFGQEQERVTVRVLAIKMVGRTHCRVHVVDSPEADCYRVILKHIKTWVCQILTVVPNVGSICAAVVCEEEPRTYKRCWVGVVYTEQKLARLFLIDHGKWTDIPFQRLFRLPDVVTAFPLQVLPCFIPGGVCGQVSSLVEGTVVITPDTKNMPLCLIVSSSPSSLHDPLRIDLLSLQSPVPQPLSSTTSDPHTFPDHKQSLSDLVGHFLVHVGSPQVSVHLSEDLKKYYPRKLEQPPRGAYRVDLVPSAEL